MTKNKTINYAVKTIYLHIGTFKTATSSIQKTLFYNREALSEINNGIFYSSIMVNQSLLPFLLFENLDNYQLNVRKNYSKKSLKRIKNELKDELIKQLRGTSSETIVFSGEAMTILKPSSIKLLKKTLNESFPNAEIKIILFTRNYISFSASQIQQNKKFGNIPYIIPVNFYKDIISNYLKYFDQDSILVFSFEDSLKHKFGPVGFFFNLIGVSDEDLNYIHIYQDNTSLSNKSIELIDYIYSQSPIYEENQERKLYLSLQPLWNISGEKYKLNEKESLNIYESTKTDAIWLKDKFGIDYINFSYDFKNKNDILIYDETYKEEIIEAFPKLSFFVKKIVLMYFNEKEKDLKNSLYYDNIKYIQMWIRKKYFYLDQTPLGSIAYFYNVIYRGKKMIKNIIFNDIDDFYT